MILNTSQKQGQWILTNKGVICTNCKQIHRLLNDYFMPTMFNSLKFCPCCGASMSNNSLINSVDCQSIEGVSFFENS